MKIAIAYPKGFWDHKHSPTRKHYIQAIQRFSDCRFVAPGWEGYDSSKPWEENLKSIHPNAVAAIFYKPEGHGKLNIPEMTGWKSSKILKVTCFNEFWWDKNRRKAEVDGFDLCVAHHENDMGRFNETGANTVNIPHSADVDTFYRTTPENRTVPVLLSGACGEEHYPFRCRMRRLMRSGAIPGTERNHPGYWLERNANDNQVDAYSDALNSSKISICTSSKWKYALAKYYESWLSGAVVAGDMPDDSHYKSQFGDLQITLDTKSSDSEISDAIRSSLNDEKSMEQRSEEGRMIARSIFTTDRYAESLLASIAENV